MFALTASLFLSSSSVIVEADVLDGLTTTDSPFAGAHFLKNREEYKAPVTPSDEPASTSHQWCLLSVILDREQRRPHRQQAHTRSSFKNRPVLRVGIRQCTTI